MRNNKGFTLIEMIVVLAVVVIITGVTSLTVVQSINQATVAKDAAELHYGNVYNEARAQVEILRSAGYGSADAFAPVPTPGGGGGDTEPTATPTPIPATPTPIPTSTPIPTPTPSGAIVVGNYTVPTVTGTPTAFPGTNTVTESGDGEYDFNAKFTIPQRSYPTYAAIYLPPGTIDIIVWYNCKVEYFDSDTNIAVISVGAWQTNPAIRVDYGGKEVDWKLTRIFDIVEIT